jgi:hypothetical protein
MLADNATVIENSIAHTRYTLVSAMRFAAETLHIPTYKQRALVERLILQVTAATQTPCFSILKKVQPAGYIYEARTYPVSANIPAPSINAKDLSQQIGVLTGILEGRLRNTSFRRVVRNHEPAPPSDGPYLLALRSGGRSKSQLTQRFITAMQKQGAVAIEQLYAFNTYIETFLEEANIVEDKGDVYLLSITQDALSQVCQVADTFGLPNLQIEYHGLEGESWVYNLQSEW